MPRFGLPRFLALLILRAFAEEEPHDARKKNETYLNWIELGFGILFG